MIRGTEHLTNSYYNDSICENIRITDYKLIDDTVIYESGKEFNSNFQRINNYVTIYTYDYNGKLKSFNCEDDTRSSADYFYLRNQQSDITHILDASGNTVIKIQI